MENYFKPVHSPSGPGEIKPRKHHHHRHLHHDQDPQSHRYTMFDDTDRNTDDSHGHHRRQQHGRYLEDSPPHAPHRHQTRQFHHSEEDEILYNSETPVTLSRASSSSLTSSSSSSSFSSWYTEESANDPFTLRHATQPQHSLSCSNIADVRRSFREDDSNEPVVFATIKHAKQDSVCSDTHVSPQKQGKGGYSSLDRCHSRSAGLLQGNASDVGGGRSRARHENYGTLYKTASLNRSLAFSEEDIMLGVSLGPKRAVSSSQLPSKGILKNKGPHNDIRKAKSMEVLSPRVSKGSDPTGKKGKGITQAEIEQARANFVQGKLQFSAFLDEITKQVISPSDLTILGLNNDKPTTVNKPAPAQAAGPEKPQLPPKKNRDSSGEERAQHPRQQGRQEKAARSTIHKHPDGSSPDKLTSYPAKKHHGSPPPNHHRQHSPSHKTHHGGNRKDRRPSPTVGSSAGDRYGRSGPHLTDGTSTSPEPIVPKQRHHRKQQQPTISHSNHTQHFSQHQPQQAHPGPAHRRPASSPTPKGVEPGHRSESSSTKSDSSRTRDTASTATSHSSEQSGRHHSPHEGHSKQHRETLWDADHLRALQEENSDLHQNLLQTVVCIESLEVELQRTRDELIHVKDKYKSLLESHSGPKQSNNLVGEHLHIAPESLNSERKHLLNCVSQLSSELDDAHRTMANLENINVPCMIKELLEKHFNSAEVIQKLLSACFSNNQSANVPQADIRSNTPKVEEAAHYWQKKSETAPQRVTAFIPFKQGGNEGSPSGQDESRHSPPFSVNDISTAIYKNMAASYAARPRPFYPQSQQQPQLSTNHTDAPTMHQQAHVGGDSWMGNGEVKVTLVEQDIVDVTSASAQQILDEFMQQLQAHKEVGGGKEQQGGQEWAGGANKTGKVAD